LRTAQSSSPTVGRRTGGWDNAPIFAVLAYFSVLLYVLLFSWLSILRHETFQSNAMDLGYTDQVVWNTLRGRFFRFSTFQNAPIDLPLDQFRRTDTLLAYHVELILAPVSLFYLLYDDPVTLLVLQTVGIALGAVPTFRLARDHLGSGLAGLVFALAYLLAPAVEGATLSDFHGVSLAASLLLWAFYLLHARRFTLFFLPVILAMLAKEDIPLLLAMIGLYVFFFLKERRVGALTAAMGLGWFLLCTQVILPYHNGLSSSPFLHRLAIFGPTLKESLLNFVREPVLLVRWLGRREVVTYLGGLLASAGFMSLFCPAILALGAPAIAMNVFSTWSWTYSEGAHYSASIVPSVFVSAIYGLGFLARVISRRTGVQRRRVVVGLAVLVLAVSGYHHHQLGISPLARTFYPPRITAHHRLGQALMQRIPPAAPLSTQSGLYPHLAHREKAYFFPAVNDAEYILLDVTSSSYPITPAKVHERAQQLLTSRAFGVLAAEDGYLLLKRGLPGGAEARLPDAFYTFARVDEETVPHPLRARFGDALELIGYDYTIGNVVHAQELPATVTTYWRVLRPLPADHTVALFFSRQDGAIVYLYDGTTPAATWYPVDRWQVGEVIRLETPVLGVGRLHGALAAVILPGADPWSAAGRLQPIEATGDQSLAVYDDGTLLELFTFQE